MMQQGFSQSDPPKDRLAVQSACAALQNHSKHRKIHERTTYHATASCLVAVVGGGTGAEGLLIAPVAARLSSSLLLS